MAFVIPTGKGLAKQILDEDYMEDTINNDLVDHQARIVALESSSGGGSGSVDSGFNAKMIGGLDTNEAVLWKRRFSPFEALLTLNKPVEFSDLLSTNSDARFFFAEENADINISDIRVTNVNLYNGEAFRVAKSHKFYFKLKKGENFFKINTGSFSGGSDNIEIRINGAAPSTYQNILDQERNAAPDAYSSNSGVNKYMVGQFYFGLNANEEQIVEVLNNDSAAKVFDIDFIEVGYATLAPAIDHTVHMNAGRANVRGSAIDIPDSDVTFTEALGAGYTGSVISNTGATVSALAGIEPAMTVVKPAEVLTFSSSVTSLNVMNSALFPSSGICLFQTSNGQRHIFSYSSKTETTVQTNSLDGIVWFSKPSKDFTVLNNLTSTTLGAATGDATINLLAEAPITITNSNNKVDFDIVISGTTFAVSATITNGVYASDLMEFNKAFNDACQTAKAINGYYYARYNNTSQLWTIGVENNPEVTELRFDFSTGTNTATSVHTALGFDTTDLSGALSYTGDTATPSLAVRAFESSTEFMGIEHPRIKYSWSADTAHTTNIQAVEDKLGIQARYIEDNVGHIVAIYTKPDVCGIEIYLGNEEGCSMTWIQVDNGNKYYVFQPDRTPSTINNNSTKGSLFSSFISFPRGSKKIVIGYECASSQMENMAHVNEAIVFFGCREYYTKPAYEKLTNAQAILKNFNISPLSLKKTPYLFSVAGALYTPTATDNVGSIAENGGGGGAFSAVADTNQHGGYVRSTVTLNDYVDIAFTTVADGGGISVALEKSSNMAAGNSTNFYLSASAINEGTDLIRSTHDRWGNTSMSKNLDEFTIIGLPSGTYTLRMKNISGTMRYAGFSIWDTVAPEPDTETVEDVTGTGQGVTTPVNMIYYNISQYGQALTPEALRGSGYLEGFPAPTNSREVTSYASANYDAYEEATTVKQFENNWYNTKIDVYNTSEVFFEMANFCRAIAFRHPIVSSYTSLNKVLTCDGDATGSTYGNAKATAGATHASASDAAMDLVCKIMSYVCTMATTTVTLTNSDSSGLKVNDKVILIDNVGAKEEAIISSIITNTSFVVKEALSVLTVANVVKVDFPGFHNLRCRLSSSTSSAINAIGYEPLAITPFKREGLEQVLETKTQIFYGAVTTDTLFYPVHSDGTYGDKTTSTIRVLAKSAASSFDLNDIKSIVISSGTLDIEITSTKMVEKVNRLSLW
jgi:hypothetical protein